MTEADIAELFIQAAEVEKRIPQVKGMRETMGGYCLPWVHDTADINMRRREVGDSLESGDDPLEEWAAGATRVLAEWEARNSKAQLLGWESCMRITSEFLTDVGQRRALWAWALAQAGNLWITRRVGKPRKISFARWCREVEHVAENTGHRRKNRALALIAQGIGGKTDLHDETCEDAVLPHTPETEHVFATVEGRHAVYDTKRVHSWRDDPSFTKTTGLSLKEWRLAKRRQQSARRRQAA